MVANYFLSINDDAFLERKGHLKNTARSKIQAASVSNGYKPDSLA